MPDVFTDSQETPAKNTPHPVTIMNEKPHRPGLFTAFTPLPEGTSFDTQEPEETIILLLRHHFITNLPWILIATFFIIVGMFLFPFLRSDTFSSLFFIPDTYLVILAALYYLVIIGYILTQFATWFYEVGLVTNIRIIDVDFQTLLSRNVAFAEIKDVVDVEVVQKGVLQNLFNFGMVEMQTQGRNPNLEFTDMPKPNVVADTISDLMRERSNDD